LAQPSSHLPTRYRTAAPKLKQAISWFSSSESATELEREEKKNCNELSGGVIH
jgi:hypothetical protein